MCRILFLYATNNSGHQKAAEAIKKSLYHISDNIKTSEIDFFTHSYPNLGPFFSKMYLEIMRSIPQTWDYLYDNQGVASITKEIRRLFNFLNIPKLYKILKNFNPDAIVCTQAVPAGFIAAEKEKGKIQSPLFVTITDFVANPYWPDKEVDCYFVPDEEIKEQLIERNVPGERIMLTGIPIDSSFSQKMPKTNIRRRLGLRPGAPTVLIMGGSQGLGQIWEAVNELLSHQTNIQIIIITGQNRYLCRHLRKKYKGQKNIKIFSRIKNISALMDASDLLISKPGGLTSAEAMSKGLPMIILSPLPGQEERNASYLVKNGVAERCSNVSMLPKMVEKFFSHPNKLMRFNTQALKMARPYASVDIANHILKFVFSNEQKYQADDRFPA